MEQLSPIKAIRAKCLDCSAGDSNEVKLCPCKDCALWPYRLGHNPTRAKKNLTDEQKQAIAERFKKAREARKKKDGEE